MKRVIAVAALVLVAVASYAAPKVSRKYVDASTLTVINKAQPGGGAFERLDVARYTLTDGADKVFRQSTGLAVVFRTNSSSISARWTTDYRTPRPITTDVFEDGLDLFIRHEGEWVFAGIARPVLKGDRYEFVIVKHLPEGEKECMLYMPMYSRVSSLEIGIDRDAAIEAASSPFKHKVVFVGSSLTHGAAASRPGMSYVARVGRIINAETPNFGHNGQCRFQQHFVDIVCNTEADAFVFDAFSNPTGKAIEENLYDFVRKIRTKHKDTPLIFLQTIKRDNGIFDAKGRANNDYRLRAATQGMARVCKDFRNVYFIDPAFDVGDDHTGTIDGLHLNDIGVERMLKVVGPRLKSILKKHGIK